MAIKLCCHLVGDGKSSSQSSLRGLKQFGRAVLGHFPLRGKGDFYNIFQILNLGPYQTKNPGGQTRMKCYLRAPFG